ncbi:hypothetical protein WA026_018443 [Henosepilachna vigintioctopunctata]|uniref:Ionotropic receptor n=1 Tax=Henosepilachna vigintioctopunctata TaxID=420089 RepID=A0AAW1V146_9CUCU
MKISRLMVNFTLTQCINFILNKNTSPTDFIIVTSNSVDILPNRPVARFEEGKAFAIPFGLKPDVMIFDNATTHEIERVYYTLIRQKTYNATAKYIFIVDILHPTLVDFVALKYLMNTIFIHMETGKIITIATYEKYKVEHSYSKLLLELGSCDDQYSLQQNFFPSKNNRNWVKRSITLVYVHTLLHSKCDKCKKPGISIEIMTSVLKNLNIPYTFLRTNTKTVNELMDSYNFNVGPLNLIPPDLFESTTPFDEETLYFYVARPEQIDRWRYILLVFSPSAWMYFVLSLLTAVAVFIVMKYINERIKNIDIIQFIFIIFLGRIKRYRTKVVSLEILVLCMVFMSVMLNYLFCSKLTYLLNGITFEQGVESFEDIANQGFFIGITQKQDMIWIKTIPEFRHYTEEKFVYCNESFNCHWRAKKDRKFTFLSGYREISAFGRILMDRNTGIPFLKFVEPPFMTVKIVSIVRRGHPLLPILNKKLEYLIESGITAKIIEKYEKPQHATPTSEPIESLKLRHIVAPFMILAVGLTLSFLVFLMEVRNEKYSPRRHKRA